VELLLSMPERAVERALHREGGMGAGGQSSLVTAASAARTHGSFDVLGAVLSLQQGGAGHDHELGSSGGGGGGSGAHGAGGGGGGGGAGTGTKLARQQSGGAKAVAGARDSAAAVGDRFMRFLSGGSK
jgi:hypothetical protein